MDPSPSGESHENRFSHSGSARLQADQTWRTGIVQVRAKPKLGKPVARSRRSSLPVTRRTA